MPGKDAEADARRRIESMFAAAACAFETFDLELQFAEIAGGYSPWHAAAANLLISDHEDA